MHYDYELRYVRGKQLVLTGTVSRAPQQVFLEINTDDDVKVHAVSVQLVLVSKKTHQYLTEESARSAELSSLKTSLWNDASFQGGYKPYQECHISLIMECCICQFLHMMNAQIVGCQ